MARVPLHNFGIIDPRRAIGFDGRRVLWQRCGGQVGGLTLAGVVQLITLYHFIS